MNKLIWLAIFSLAISAATAQTLVKESQSLADWIPAKVGEYNVVGQPVGTVGAYQGKPYYMALKRFKKQESELNISVFDYRQAPAAMQFNSNSADSNFETEAQVMKTIMVKGYRAWSAYDKKKNSSQMFINISDQYLVHLSATDNTPEFLTRIAENLPYNQLPK